MTSGRDWGHRASMRVDYDQLREMCSSASLSPRESIVDVFRLAVCSVPGLSNLPVFDTTVATLEATWKPVTSEKVL